MFGENLVFGTVYARTPMPHLQAAQFELDRETAIKMETQHSFTVMARLSESNSKFGAAVNIVMKKGTTNGAYAGWEVMGNPFVISHILIWCVITVAAVGTLKGWCLGKLAATVEKAVQRREEGKKSRRIMCRRSVYNDEDPPEEV